MKLETLKDEMLCLNDSKGVEHVCCFVEEGNSHYHPSDNIEGQIPEPEPYVPRGERIRQDQEAPDLQKMV